MIKTVIIGKWQARGMHSFFPSPYLPTTQKGALAKTFLSEARQPEVDFLQPWAVVWFKLSGKSSL